MKTNFDIMLSKKPGFKVVVVGFFGSSKEYNYKTCLNIHEGDMVVVPTGGIFSVAKVLSTMSYPEYYSNLTGCNTITLKWIASKVVMREYEDMLSLEKKLHELEMKIKIESMFKEMQSPYEKPWLNEVLGIEESDKSKLTDDFL